MIKREFLDTVFALAPNEANAIMDALARIALAMIILAFFSLVAVLVFLALVIIDWIMGSKA